MKTKRFPVRIRASELAATTHILQPGWVESCSAPPLRRRRGLAGSNDVNRGPQSERHLKPTTSGASLSLAVSRWHLPDEGARNAPSSHLPSSERRPIDAEAVSGSRGASYASGCVPSRDRRTRIAGVSGSPAPCSDDHRWELSEHAPIKEPYAGELALRAVRVDWLMPRQGRRSGYADGVRSLDDPAGLLPLAVLTPACYPS